MRCPAARLVLRVAARAVQSRPDAGLKGAQVGAAVDRPGEDPGPAAEEVQAVQPHVYRQRAEGIGNHGARARWYLIRGGQRQVRPVGRVLVTAERVQPGLVEPPPRGPNSPVQLMVAQQFHRLHSSPYARMLSGCRWRQRARSAAALEAQRGMRVGDLPDPGRKALHLVDVGAHPGLARAEGGFDAAVFGGKQVGGEYIASGQTCRWICRPRVVLYQCYRSSLSGVRGMVPKTMLMPSVRRSTGLPNSWSRAAERTPRR